MTVVVAVLVAVLVLTAIVSVGLTGRTLSQHVAGVLTATVLALLGLLGVVGGPVTTGADVLGRIVLVELFVVAVLGGSPVTATVLWLVDRRSARTDTLERAGEVLRGGAWIGAFERCAVFASLVAGWPEGLAVVLALKGLGRYSELRGTPAGPVAGAPPGGSGPAPTGSSGGVAERFIIGTFASVLWACGCAGVLLSLGR